MKKILALIVILLIGGFVYYSINYVDKGEADYTNVSNEYNNKLRELTIKKEMLQEELDLYDNIDIIVPDMGSVIFMLSDTKKDHLDNAVKVLSDNGYYGVIALSKSHLPNNNDPEYFNSNDIDNLTSLGYELIIRLEKNENAIETYNYFTDYGYSIKGFYIPSQTISIETIDDIKSIGNMVIIGNFGEYEDDEIMLIEKYGNHYSNVKDKFMESIDESNTIAISVGYGDNRDEKYEYVNFSSMLLVINPYVDSENTDVCNISESVERRAKLEEELDTINSEDRKKIKELRNSIEEINKELIGLRSENE